MQILDQRSGGVGSDGRLLLWSPVHVNWTKRPLHEKTANDNPK